MVNYSKWDNLELSDDSDIEVHPNVDKRSFIRAKQNKIHTERQERKLQIERLKYERIINETLMQRLSALLSSLKLYALETHTFDPNEIAFQKMIDLAPHNPMDDNPPSRPEGVFHPAPPLPTYSKMIAELLDNVKRELDEKSIGSDLRSTAFIESIDIHLQNIQGLQRELVEKLDALEREGARTITSESYHTGYTASHVNKGKSRDKSTEPSKPELLNPHFAADNALPDSCGQVITKVPQDTDENQDASASSAAKTFAMIDPSDYRASHEYISLHPEILRESEIDGLLVEAFNFALELNNTKMWQCIHQAILIQYCLMLGGDGVRVFFHRVTSPGHQARDMFLKEVAEKSQRIRKLAAKQHDTERGNRVEQIQIQTVEPGTVIHIQIPDADSEDVETRKARSIFEDFAPNVKEALESRSLESLNSVLGEMDVVEAEILIGLLGDAGCLNIDREIIDTTTVEGKQLLQDLKAAADTNTEV